MSDREDDRERDVDDLFGDLDEFFAPIEDVDWPEGEEDVAEEGDAGPDEDAEDWAPAIEIPEEDDLAVPDVDVSEEPGVEEPAARTPEPGAPVHPARAAEEPDEPELGELFDEDEVAGPIEPAGAAEPGAAEPGAAAEPPAAEVPEAEAPTEPERELESTAEMSGEDWERLRGALGEEQEEVAAEAAAPPPAPGKQPGDISVDDLRRPPTPYEDLPGAEAPEEPGPEDAVLAEEATFEPEGEPMPPAVGPEGEPEPQEVEAAAAHFAEGLGPDEVERDLLADLDEGPERPGEPVLEEEEDEPVPASEPTAEAPAITGPEIPADEPEGPVVRVGAPEPPAIEDEEQALPGGTAPPTWQEPAAYAADEDEYPEEQAPADRNLMAAVASGAILAAAAIALLAISKGAFVVLAIGIVLLGQGELYAVLKGRGFQPATALGLVAGLFVMVGAYTRGASGQGEAALLFGVALGMMLSVLWYTAAPPASRRGLVANVAATMVGVVYVPVLASFALLLLAVPGAAGRNILLSVLGLTVLYDVTAYAIGTVWGHRPLAPTVSPKKSREGAIGATLVVLIVGMAIVSAFEPFNAATGAGLALVIAVFAPLGDLAESALKRDLGVKDMGSLLPGHGGVLDRIDAILFTAPAAYYLVKLVGLG